MSTTVIEQDEQGRPLRFEVEGEGTCRALSWRYDGEQWLVTSYAVEESSAERLADMAAMQEEAAALAKRTETQRAIEREAEAAAAARLVERGEIAAEDVPEELETRAT